MDNYGVEEFTDGSTDGSISDMAVADNVIVVGSYNTRNQWTCLDGGTARYEGDGFKVGGISGFSSYGTLSDGRELPLVCAPGAAIISSVSYPFAKIAEQAYGEEYLNFMCRQSSSKKNASTIGSKRSARRCQRRSWPGRLPYGLKRTPT